MEAAAEDLKKETEPVTGASEPIISTSAEVEEAVADLTKVAEEIEKEKLNKFVDDTNAALNEKEKQDEEDEIYWENDADELDEEMKAKLDPDNLPRAPFRTDPEAPNTDEKGKYIPQVLTEEQRNEKEYLVAIERLGCTEKKPSRKAYKNFSLYFNLLSEQSSRIAVSYQRGATLKDRNKFTHCFHLVDGNGFELMESVAHLKRGDVWACTIYGDELWHTPMADRNILRDPKYRARHHEEEAAAKLKYLEKLNKIASPKKTLGLRLTEVEEALKGVVEVTKIYQQQQTTISMLLNLRTKDKYNHEMVEYLREQAGIHDARVAKLQEVQNMTLRTQHEILSILKESVKAAEA